MFEQIVVWLIFVAAAAYIVRRFIKNRDAGGCGCAGCAGCCGVSRGVCPRPGAGGTPLLPRNPSPKR